MSSTFAMRLFVLQLRGKCEKPFDRCRDKEVVYLLRKRRCRHEFENDRKCRKETKEKRKVREGCRCSSGLECVPEIFNVCVPRVYKSESGSVLQGRCFLQCNLSLWWNV